MLPLKSKILGLVFKMPFLPQTFDRFLMFTSYISNKTKHAMIKKFISKICSWEKTSTGEHHLGGVEFYLNNKAIGHIHGNGRIDILFSKKLKETLVSQNMVSEHKFLPGTGWTTFTLINEEDFDHAVSLMQLSYNILYNKLFATKKLEYLNI